jgi:hypothetical protein
MKQPALEGWLRLERLWRDPGSLLPLLSRLQVGEERIGLGETGRKRRRPAEERVHLAKDIHQFNRFDTDCGPHCCLLQIHELLDSNLNRSLRMWLNPPVKISLPPPIFSDRTFRVILSPSESLKTNSLRKMKHQHEKKEGVEVAPKMPPSWNRIGGIRQIVN